MPNKIGAFPAYEARLTQKGGATLSNTDRSVIDTYTVYIPEGKSPYQSGVTVRGLPSIGDDWKYGDTLVSDKWQCDQITWSNTFPNEYWEARVRYRRKSDISDSQYPPPTPPGGGDFLRVSFGSSTWRVDVENDMGNGRPIRNSVGDRFQDAIAADRCAPQITIEADLATAPVSQMTDNSGTINNADITVAGITIPKHCGLITITSVKEVDMSQEEGSQVKWHTTYVIRIMHQPMQEGANLNVATEQGGWTTRVIEEGEDAGWDVVVLNTGYNCFGTDPTAVAVKKTPIEIYRDPFDLSKGKTKPNDPQLLDDIGVFNPDLAWPIPLEEIYWWRWQVYPDSDWSVLGLPGRVF